MAEKIIKKLGLVLILTTAFLQPLHAEDNPMGDLMYSMFRMMLAIGNQMAGSIEGSNSFNFSGNLGSNYYPGMGGWPGGGFPGAWSRPGLSPGGTPGFGFPRSSMPFGGFPSRPGYGVPYYPQWRDRQRGHLSPGGYYRTGPVSALDGQWQGSSGEILEVRGNRFRLRSPQAATSGTLRVKNGQLRLYSPQTGAVMQYQYKRSLSSLALQDPYNRTIVFQQRPNRFNEVRIH